MELFEAVPEEDVTKEIEVDRDRIEQTGSNRIESNQTRSNQITPNQTNNTKQYQICANQS
jgi:hypothetical protein